MQVRQEDYFSASVCKDGRGNHGGVGHSSKRIWLAALSRGIKTGWADKPLLLSNFHDQAFIIMHGKHILHSVMLPPGSRCVDTVEGSGHRVCVQVPCAGTSSQNLHCTTVHIDSFGHCSFLSKTTFIGRTSKCWTTKLLWQVCSHHNRPDEGI